VESRGKANGKTKKLGLPINIVVLLLEGMKGLKKIHQIVVVILKPEDMLLKFGEIITKKK